MTAHSVSTVAELVDALASGRRNIEVRGTLHGMPTITLPPGVRLRGGTLHFGAKGIRLTRDNELADVTVHTPEHEVAIFNDTSVADLGTLTLRDVRTVGQVLLVAADAVRTGHVSVRGLRVLRADLRSRTDRPPLVGVDAMQGAFTLWNRQEDPAVTITAELLDIGAGTAEAPVRGGGVLVGGTLRVSTLSTAEIHTDGGIPPGTPDLISGGVLVFTGATVHEVVNEGPVTTLGPNDMVLDNSGEVTTWTARAPVTSYGPSGVGFVNFGAIGRLDVRAPVRTFGTGARGFNFYAGTLREASFQSIATHGDGSIGVQVARELPVLRIAEDLSTAGGEGQSLVKGVQVVLRAIALSVQPEGRIGSVVVGGRIRTEGNGIPAVEVEGRIDSLLAAGEISRPG